MNKRDHTGARKRNNGFRNLEIAVFLAHRMGTVDGYSTAVKKVDNHKKKTSITLKINRSHITRETKRDNVTIINKKESKSFRDKKLRTRTVESMGGMPRIYRSDKTYGYIHTRTICMLPIKEGTDEDSDIGQPFHISFLKWPMYYNQSDFGVYNQKLYTRSFFNKKK